MYRVFIVLFLFLNSLFGQPVFTELEKKWIQDNPTVIVGGEMDWAPFDFVDADGKYNGISKDYLDLISKKSGLKFKLVTGYTWNGLIENFKDKKIDLLPAVYYSKQREQYGSYTSSYYTVRDYIFTKEDSKITSLEDLKGKTLAIPKGYTSISKINKKHPEINILETRSIVDSIAAVLSDQADATLEVHAVMTYTIQTNAIEGLKVVSQETLGTNPLHMLVQKENQTLLSIINKTIIEIDKEEQKNIANKWLTSFGNEHLPHLKYALMVAGIFILVILLLLYKQYIQKKSNRKVEEQRKELETIFQTTKDGIAILDLQTNFLFFNDSYLEMTGYTKEELLGKSCIGLGIMEDHDKSAETLKEVLTKGYIENFEKTCVVKDGKRLQVNMSIALMPDKKRLLISTKDVTEIKKKERLLNEYVKMIDDHVIISSTDLEGNITYVSNALSSMTGYPKEKLLGQNHRIIKHGDMPKHTYEDMWNTIIADKTWYGEIKNKKKDGNYFWSKMIVSPTFDEFGVKTGYTAIRQDITDKKIVEEKTKEQNILLSLFDHGDSVLFRWRNDEQWSINYVSSNVANLLGYTQEEFLSGKIAYAQCIYEEDLERVIDEVNKGKESSENFFRHESYRIITKDGTIKWVLDYTVVQKNDFGAVTHFLGYIIDVTEQENTLRNLEKFIDTQDNIVSLTDGKEITFANRKFFDFLGFKDLESFKKEHHCICEYFIENDRFFHLAKIKKDENWIDVMQTLPHSQRIVSIMGNDFKIHAFSITISKFDENLLMVGLTDISQTMIEHIKLEEKTVHDKLTGAYNREYFEQNYQKLINEFNKDGFKVAVALLDIDYFKLVNDNYGHDVGDAVLIQFVKVLQKYSRKDDILIRWGGEEFVMMLKVDSQNGLLKALEHLRKVIEIQDFPSVGQKTCSIGGTIYKDAEDIEVAIKRADEAVYEAKESGRNKVVLH